MTRKIRDVILLFAGYGIGKAIGDIVYIVWWCFFK